MKKVIPILFLMFLFSGQTGFSQSDKDLVKLQTWLKGLGKVYTVKGLKNLAGLDLWNKQLTRIPKEIGQFKNVEIIDLRFNQLISLPKEIGRLIYLEGLVLNSYQLTSLPKEIGQLKKLKYLSLRKNPISQKEREKIKKLLPKCYIKY